MMSFLPTVYFLVFICFSKSIIIPEFHQEPDSLENTKENVLSFLIRRLISVEKDERRLIDTVESIKKDITEIRKAENGIGFTNEFQHSGIGTIMVGQKLSFNKTIWQMGDGYDTKSGIFTCSVSGLYHVSTSIISKDSDIQLHFLHNNNFLGTVDKMVSNSGFSFLSVVVTVRLTKNDTVSLILIPAKGSPNQTELANIHHRSHLTIIRIAN